jgi:hypothetical protein
MGPTGNCKVSKCSPPQELPVIEGVFIGGLIGLVTGIVACACLKILNQVALADIKQMFMLVGQFFAIPTFWFGGPWVSTELLHLVEKSLFVLPYIISLAMTFFIVMSYPVYKWIRRLGEKFGDDRSA